MGVDFQEVGKGEVSADESMSRKQVVALVAV